jgi:hypothetical protein
VAGPRFAESGPDPEHLARAAQVHQAKLAQLGVEFTIAQAVTELHDRHGMGRSSDELDPANLLRAAAALGLSRRQLVKKAKDEQAVWARMGAPRTLFEAAWYVIREFRASQNRRMTPAELAAMARP